MLSRTKQLVLFTTLSLTLAFLAGCPPAGSAKVGLPAPALTLDRLGGGKVNLAELKGKVVLINFWATWCDPCKAEMPELEKLHRTLEGQPFMLLAVSVDDSRASVEKFSADRKLSIPILLDPGGNLGRTWGSGMYPESYIIDKSGVIADKIIGVIEYDEVLKKIQALIKK